MIPWQKGAVAPDRSDLMRLVALGAIGYAGQAFAFFTSAMSLPVLFPGCVMTTFPNAPARTFEPTEIWPSNSPTISIRFVLSAPAPAP